MNRQDQHYWDNRVITYKDNLQSMVLAKPTFNFHDKLSRAILHKFKDMSVIDVCCGYGRLADVFLPDNYLGFDFSEEMVKLGKELHPEHNIIQKDWREFEIPEVDIVFEAISLDMMGLTAHQFIKKYWHKVRVGVICLQDHNYIIKLK